MQELQEQNQEQQPPQTEPEQTQKQPPNKKQKPAKTQKQRDNRIEFISDFICLLIFVGIGVLIARIVFAGSPNRGLYIKIGCLVMGIVTIISCISTARENKRKTPLASWLLFLGFFAVTGVLVAADSGAIREHFKQNAEAKIESKLELAEYRISNGMNDEKTVKLFKKAAWPDEHLKSVRDASRLASIYNQIGTVYFNMDDFSACREYYTKAADLYKSYGEAAYPQRSNIATRLMLIDAKEDNREAALQDGEQLAEWNRSHPERKGIDTATMFIFLAQTYYNLGEYEKAAGYFADGTAMLEECGNWGSIDSDDTANAIVLACAYQCAALNAQKLGDQQSADACQKKYEDTVWYHDLSEEDLERYRNEFHWMEN